MSNFKSVFLAILMLVLCTSGALASAELLTEEGISEAGAAAVYRITASASPAAGGSIQPKGSVKVQPGGSQTFTIAANAAYDLTNVLVDKGSIGPVTSYTFTNVVKNHSIKAVFKKKSFTITASAEANGSLSPKGNLKVFYGTSKVFKAKPKKGYSAAIELDGFVVSQSVALSKPAKYKLSNITADHSIKALFFTGNLTLPLAISKDGTGTGTVTSSPAGVNCGSICSAAFDYNSTVTLTANSDPNSAFTGWSGACAGTGTCTLTMNGELSATANFIRQWTLAVAKAGTGTGTVTSTPAAINCGSTCSGSINDGTTITLTATPDVNSAFTGWSGACSGTGTCTLTLTADANVTANFNMRASLSAGTIVPVTSSSVPATGGTIQVSASGTPIDGVNITIPGGALSSTTTFAVGYHTGTLTTNRGTPGSAVLVLETGAPAQMLSRSSATNLVRGTTNTTQFDQPISITVPFSDATKVPVPYYVDADGNLHPAQLTNIDRTANTFTFQTFHASVFTWIMEILTGNSDTMVGTGYVPVTDGFQVVNNGSSYNRGGECFGMTSFSLWYFMHSKSTGGDFYPRFMSVLGQDSSGQNLTGQDIIATRSFISIAQQWNTYLPTVAREENLTQQGRYATIKNTISNTLDPVLIYLYHTTGSTAAHSVLAYAFNESSGAVSIYDPNYPGTTNTIQYDQTSNSFNPYGGYDGIVYNGDGSLNLTEPYQQILADAEINFNSSTMPTIEVTSHTSGAIVTDHNINLTGTVHSAEVLATKIKILVGSVSFSGNVNTDGSFSIPVSLESGVNHLKFALQGNDTSGNLIDLSPTNMDTQDFTIELSSPASVILWTLTWDKDDTDLDTYVIDPTGDYSSYYHMLTAAGGVLDHDITTGFGPEHWTLLNTDTIYYNQPYRFRVHYFSDHGNGGTNYTVTIKLYEGTSREVTYSYTGYLSANDPSNNSPTGTGSDWADIAELTLTEGTQGAPTVRFAPMSAATLPSMKAITITAPVPPLSERMKEKGSLKALPKK